uniref:Uncharacterized protein n=1 Tax=Panagrellus redivivus TaxID=6233 RepID=A0A7E4ZXY2_PANRE
MKILQLLLIPVVLVSFVAARLHPHRHHRAVRPVEADEVDDNSYDSRPYRRHYNDVNIGEKRRHKFQDRFIMSTLTNCWGKY